MKKQYIYPLQKGWKENTWYIVEIAFSKFNPVFKALFYSGFLNEGTFTPGGYNRLVGSTLAGKETIKDVYYMKVLKELISDKDMDYEKVVLPNERIEEINKGE